MEQYQSAEKKNQESKTTVSTAGKINIEAKSDRENEDKELMKILRRPRSKKYMKALKNIDLLSAGDEMIIEQLKREAGIGPMEEMTFQPEDIENFKKRISEIVETEINKEEEEMRRLEEEKRRRDSELLCVLGACSLTGCFAHTLDSKGAILQHYPRAEVCAMGEAHKKACEILWEYRGWSCVEIHRGFLVHRTEFGDTIKIYKLDE